MIIPVQMNGKEWNRQEVSVNKTVVITAIVIRQEQRQRTYPDMDDTEKLFRHPRDERDTIIKQNFK